jgi:tetratricopeptide (TPR) repeat protein
MRRRQMAILFAAFFLIFVASPAGLGQSGPPETQSQPAAGQAGVSQVSPEELGDIYMARKDYKEAAAAYKTLTQKSPNNATYLNKLGMAYQQLEYLGAASKSYEHAIKADPKFVEAWNNLGTVYYARKKFGKAIHTYQKAIAIRPDMAVLYSNLGYAYFSDKKYDESIAAFRKVLEIDPEYFERAGSRSAPVLQNRSVENRGRFYFMLAKSFAQTNNVERCLHYLRKAREEGFKELGTIKTDPAFSAVISDPGIQEFLAPHPRDTAHP